jgi:ABC-type multidrug transport system ATPase subunit
VFLSSHILSDVERTCDEVVMVNHGEVAFSRGIAAFQPEGDDWEIEVAGWTAAHREVLGDVAFSVASERDHSALLVCAAAQKQALLRRLTSLPLDVGTVQRRRGASLEDLYLKHVGKA